MPRLRIFLPSQVQPTYPSRVGRAMKTDRFNTRATTDLSSGFAKFNVLNVMKDKWELLDVKWGFSLLLG